MADEGSFLTKRKKIIGRYRETQLKIGMKKVMCERKNRNIM